MVTSRQESALLKVGDRFPPLDAQGWINGPPPKADGSGVKLLVVDLWSRWCPMCDQSAPGLERVYQKYSGQGVAFASLTTLQQEVVQAHVNKHRVAWPNGYGMTSGTVAAMGATSAMPGPPEYELAPTLYLVGPDGLVKWADNRGRYRHVAPEVWERSIDAAIDAALAGTPLPKN